MQQVKWFERSFNFSGDDNIFPAVRSRLAGTPIRIDHFLQPLEGAILELKPAGSWSVKEHIGHLGDIESLWQGRLVDILSGTDYLRDADLENTKTHQANHNATPLEELVERFREERRKTMVSLKLLHQADIYKAAKHPRLETPMRVMDLFQFVADHDDHHLVRVEEIVDMVA